MYKRQVLSTHNANAEVAGNGVRLRNNPNTNSKILELMYSGEDVYKRQAVLFM